MGVVGWDTVEIHKDNDKYTMVVMGFAMESGPPVCSFLKLSNNVGMASGPNSICAERWIWDVVVQDQFNKTATANNNNNNNGNNDVDRGINSSSIDSSSNNSNRNSNNDNDNNSNNYSNSQQQW